MSNIYEAEATSIGGRTGMAASSDGHLRVKLAPPETLGGPGGEGTNPEQLFAAGYAACFLSAIRAAAAEENATIAEDANVTATVSLSKFWKYRNFSPSTCRLLHSGFSRLMCGMITCSIVKKGVMKEINVFIRTRARSLSAVLR